MNDITLLTVDDIKEITSISKNISPETLSPYILIAEEYFVYEVLGEGLTNELKTQLTGNTLTGLNQTLLQTYIKPLAAYGSWLEGSPFIHMKTVQKGIVKQSSDNSINVDMDEFTAYRQHIKDKVMFFQDRMKDYLERNKTSYPLYSTTCSTGNNYNSTGIYLGKY